MNLQRFLRSVMLLSGSTFTLLAADVDSFLLAKGQHLKQTNATAPAAVAADLPYRFYAAAQGSAITGASITLPNRQRRALTATDESFELQQAFPTKAKLDAAFKTGTYPFSIATSSTTNAVVLKLSPESYPPVPHITHLPDLAAIESTFPTTLTWAPFAGATARDVIFVEIYDPQSGDPLFATPDILDPAALSATNVSCEIPANILAPGKSYEGRLLFVRRVDSNTNAPAPNLAGFYRETTFPLATLPASAVAAGRVQFNASGASVPESAGKAMLTVTRSGNSGAISLNVSSANGTALNGADYAGINQAITLPEGISSTNISIPVLNDFLLEGNETFTLQLSALTGGAVLGNRSNAVVTILDDENRANGTFQFSRNSFTGLEKGKPLAVSVRRVGGSTDTATVNFYTLNGTATGGVDYVATNGTLTFGPKVVSRNINLFMLDDSVDEVDETFSVVLDQPSAGAALSSTTLTTVSIKDNDLAGVVQFGAASVSVNENTNVAIIPVKRSGGTAGGVTVQFNTVNGTASAGLDYTASSGTVTFAAGETVKTIAVPLLGDFSAETDETFSVLLSNVSGGAKLGGLTNLTCTIVDDENSVSFTNANYSVTEGTASITLNVVRSGSLNSAVSVNFSTFNGSATAANDFSGTNGTLHFPAKTSVRSITIPIVNDNVIENTESFSVRLSSPSGGVQIGSLSNSVVTITDNDAAGSIRFSATSYTGKEGTTAKVTIQRVNGTSAGVTVQFTTSPGTATTADYANASQTITFAGGETEKVVNVTLNSDSTSEGTETVNLTLSNATGGATLGTPATATLNISNVTAGGGGGGGGGGGNFNLTGPGMKASASMGGGFGGETVFGVYFAGILTITGIDPGTTSRTINITVSQPAGTTGTIPMNTGGNFFGFSHTAINTSTFCSTTKTFNSVSPANGSLTIVEWDVVNKRFKATFSFTAQGVESGTTCPGKQPTDGGVPREKPSITSGQVWVNYQ